MQLFPAKEFDGPRVHGHSDRRGDRLGIRCVRIGEANGAEGWATFLNGATDFSDQIDSLPRGDFRLARLLLKSFALTVQSSLRIHGSVQISYKVAFRLCEWKIAGSLLATLRAQWGHHGRWYSFWCKSFWFSDLRLLGSPIRGPLALLYSSYQSGEARVNICNHF